jgi:DNA-binding CsgD family transcriptional regulator
LVACGLAYVGSLLDHAPSREVAARLVDSCPPEWGLFAAPRAAARAWVTGDEDDEVAVGLAEAYRVAIERGQAAVAMVFAMELIRTGGEPAARYIESSPPGGPEIRHLSRYRAAVLSGDLAELETVAAELRDSDIRVFAIALYARLAAAHREAGRQAAAAAAAATARELARKSGGIELPSLRLLTSVAELSPREREVAVSVSRGLSNRDIAAELGLSVRTIEGHVMRACRRLEVTTRAELADAIRLVRG